jgi:hypothetical protein
MGGGDGTGLGLYIHKMTSTKGKLLTSPLQGSLRFSLHLCPGFAQGIKHWGPHVVLRARIMEFLDDNSHVGI